jgi:hypothetical protein
VTLDEQAERQRLRAPEPLPEAEIQREIADDHIWARVSDNDVAIVAAVPIALLVILGLTVSWWVFWTGLLVLVVAISISISMQG